MTEKEEIEVKEESKFNKPSKKLSKIFEEKIYKKDSEEISKIENPDSVKIKNNPKEYKKDLENHNIAKNEPIKIAETEIKRSSTQTIIKFKTKKKVDPIPENPKEEKIEKIMEDEGSSEEEIIENKLKQEIKKLEIKKELYKETKMSMTTSKEAKKKKESKIISKFKETNTKNKENPFEGSSVQKEIPKSPSSNIFKKIISKPSFKSLKIFLSQVTNILPKHDNKKMNEIKELKKEFTDKENQLLDTMKGLLDSIKNKENSISNQSQIIKNKDEEITSLKSKNNDLMQVNITLKDKLTLVEKEIEIVKAEMIKEKKNETIINNQENVNQDPNIVINSEV